MSRITVLIPAHNEEGLLSATILAIEEQTTKPTSIVVVSDNSTDRTPDIVREWGGIVQLFESSNNKHRKAGALNQALDALLPGMDDDDWILVVDADSCLSTGFITRALQVAEQDATIGAIGGIFLAEGQTNLLGDMQAIEYTRYAREIGRDQGKARVLTGTSTMARVKALREVKTARTAGNVPGSGYYNATALCEDFELTLALKTLGYRCVSPKECTVRTEVMDTPQKLWRQRLRWQRGALQALHAYGLTATTKSYFLKQGLTVVGQLAMVSLTGLFLWALVSGTLTFQPFWFAIGLFFALERVVSCWRAGLKSRVLAALILPDLVYDGFISVVFVAVWIQVLLRREGQWGIATIDQARAGV